MMLKIVEQLTCMGARADRVRASCVSLSALWGLMVASTSNANGMMAAVWGRAFTVVPISAYLSGSLASSVAAKSNSSGGVTRAV